jgi:hypothetical protein
MYEIELERQAAEGARLRAQMRTDGTLRTHAAIDEGAAAMTAHSILSPEQRNQLEQARDRYRRAAQARPKVNRVAHDMDPPSLVAHIQARAK